MSRAQARKGTTALYSAFDADSELKSLVFVLVGVERPKFEEFLRSIRGVLMDGLAANIVTVSDAAAAATAAAVPIVSLGRSCGSVCFHGFG